MSIDGTKLSGWEPVYTFIGDDGENINIHSGRLRSWCLDNKGLDLYSIPIEPRMSKLYIKTNAVSRERVAELHARYKAGTRFDPLIFAATAPIARDAAGNLRVDEVLHVDGHHRYVLYSALKIPTAEAYVLTPEQWQPFIITGLRPLTREAFASIPIMKRNY